jgi:Tfp pilus assembly protein PilO
MSKREKILIAVALVAVLGFVYFNYFLTPVQKQTREIEAALEDNRTKAMEMAAYQKAIDRAKEDLAGIDRKSEDLIAKIPEELDHAELMMEIDRITTNNGRIESVVFDDTEERAYYMAVPVVLEVYCTYSQMHDMLRQLEQSKYLNLLRDMKVNVIPAMPEDVSPGQERELNMMLSLDFLGLSVNESAPQSYDFMGGGDYGNGDLFGGVSAESAETAETAE